MFSHLLLSERRVHQIQVHRKREAIPSPDIRGYSSSFPFSYDLRLPYANILGIKNVFLVF